MSKEKLPLVIEGKNYEWAEQYITGIEVKTLGGLPTDSELYLTIKEPWKDERIGDDEKVDLARPGIEQFFIKEKEVEIIVNGTRKEWEKPRITLAELAVLAFGVYHPEENWVYTMAYEDGPKQNPEGSMDKDKNFIVFVKNKMIFHGSATDKS
jgi:hypothetical protein